MITLRGRFALVVAMLAMGVVLGACGGDESNDSAGASSNAGTTEAAASPEETIAPDAQVGAALVELKGVAEKAADAPDADQSKEAAEGLEDVWKPIEGTVKKNEPDLYLEVEDSFERLSSGDLANAKKGEATLVEAVDAYLAKHPEGAENAEGSPESHIAPDAEVTAGLKALEGVGDKVARSADGAASKEAAEGLEEVWEPIEGTVKKNEPDLYLDIEDSFQRMSSGDLANAKKGAAAMQTAVDDYLAKHP